MDIPKYSGMQNLEFYKELLPGAVISRFLEKKDKRTVSDFCIAKGELECLEETLEILIDTKKPITFKKDIIVEPEELAMFCEYITEIQVQSIAGIGFLAADFFENPYTGYNVQTIFDAAREGVKIIRALTHLQLMDGYKTYEGVRISTLSKGITLQICRYLHSLKEAYQTTILNYVSMGDPIPDQPLFVGSETWDKTLSSIQIHDELEKQTAEIHMFIDGIYGSFLDEINQLSILADAYQNKTVQTQLGQMELMFNKEVDVYDIIHSNTCKKEQRYAA